MHPVVVASVSDASSIAAGTAATTPMLGREIERTGGGTSPVTPCLERSKAEKSKNLPNIKNCHALPFLLVVIGEAELQAFYPFPAGESRGDLGNESQRS